MNAFIKVVAQQVLKRSIKNIFSFGDSLLERKALFTTAKSIESRILSKSVKLIESANIKALKKQIAIISNNIENMVKHPNNIDLIITPEIN